jgi:hypothetical protein
MNTQITTIGAAVLLQNIVRYAAYVAIAWLALSFADGWVMAWIETARPQ